MALFWNAVMASIISYILDYTFWGGLGLFVILSTIYFVLKKHGVPFKKHISLKNAVKKAHTSASTSVRETTSELKKSEIFGFFIEAFTNDGVRFYGKAPLSNEIVEIPQNIVELNRFKEDNRLYCCNSGEYLYKNCVIKNEDLRRYIKSMAN